MSLFSLLSVILQLWYQPPPPHQVDPQLSILFLFSGGREDSLPFVVCFLIPNICSYMDDSMPIEGLKASIHI